MSAERPLCNRRVLGDFTLVVVAAADTGPRRVVAGTAVVDTTFLLPFLACPLLLLRIGGFGGVVWCGTVRGRWSGLRRLFILFLTLFFF